MNDKTLELIQQLATKFGTTADHLWGVLIKQAPVSCGCDLVVLIAYAFFFIWGFRKFIHQLRTNTSSDKDALYFVGGALTLLGGGLLLLMLAFIPETISGFTNPEYWAMIQLHIIK